MLHTNKNIGLTKLNSTSNLLVLRLKKKEKIFKNQCIFKMIAYIYAVHPYLTCLCVKMLNVRNIDPVIRLHSQG